MNRKPKTIGHDELIERAVKKMKSSGIGSLIVTKSKKPVGIITPIELSSLEGKNLKKISVKDVMKTGLICVSPNDSLNYAVMLMTRHKIRRLPVIEGEKLVGIITHADMSDFYENLVERTKNIYSLRKSMGVGY